MQHAHNLTASHAVNRLNSIPLIVLNLLVRPLPVGGIIMCGGPSHEFVGTLYEAVLCETLPNVWIYKPILL